MKVVQANDDYWASWFTNNFVVAEKNKKPTRYEDDKIYVTYPCSHTFGFIKLNSTLFEYNDEVENE